MIRGRVLSALAPIAVLALTGCTTTAEVPYDAGAVSASVGEVLRVDFGWVKQSVGDNWFLVAEPDSDVLVETGWDLSNDHPECNSGDVGCPVGLVWEFEVVGTGATELVFQYCFRTGPDDCVGGKSEPAPEPVTLTVDVSD
jgi:hypothetical protein